MGGILSGKAERALLIYGGIDGFKVAFGARPVVGERFLGAVRRVGGVGMEVDETNCREGLTGSVSASCAVGWGASGVWASRLRSSSRAWRRSSSWRASRKLRWVELTMRWRRARVRSQK